MKKIIITIFIFFTSFNIFADDISDFEIEGISIGDSALDYLSENQILSEIKRNTKDYQYLKNPDKFGEVYIIDKNFETYSQISFFVKQNDEDYKIYMIRGILSFDILNDCINLQKEIEDDFKIMFQDFEKRENSYPAKNDTTGESMKYDVIFDFPNGDNITLQCSEWSEKIKKKNNWISGISVAILTKEFVNWITNY